MYAVRIYVRMHNYYVGRESWTVRGPKPGGVEIFRTRAESP